MKSNYAGQTSDGAGFSDESHLLDELIGEVRALGEKIGAPLPALEASGPQELNATAAMTVQQEDALTREQQLTVIALDRAISTLQVDRQAGIELSVGVGETAEDRVLRIASRYRR